MALDHVVPLPLPPVSYEQRYFNETVRTLNLYFRQIQLPGEQVSATLRLLQVSVDPGIAPEGTVWHDKAANVLRIVDDTYVKIPLTGATLSTSSGTVTP